MEVISSKHNSPETAYVIADYPFGMRLRCFKRIWVETGTKGAGKGLQRIGYQTTVKRFNIEYTDNGLNLEAPMAEPRAWNKPKFSTYGSIAILWIDPSTGYVETAILGQFPWTEHLDRFADRYGDALDDEQKARFEHLDRLFRKVAERAERAAANASHTITELSPV